MFNMHTGYLSIMLLLLKCATLTSGITRKYFIASQDIIWDYAPQGINFANPNEQSYADKFLKRSDDRIGHQYKKSLTFQYTDDTFKTQVPKRPILGLVGPVIHAEVGDTLDITYLNNASYDFSLHPHAVSYLKDAEGARYLDGTSLKMKIDDIVPPGQKVNLIWNVTDTDAPTDMDPNCIPSVYHSHVSTHDKATGVGGVLIICKKGILDSNNRRTDVDDEIPILVENQDENMSPHFDENIQRFCMDPSMCKKLKENGDEDFFKSNVMRSINGYMYGHLPELEICVGHTVAIYGISYGNEQDIHSIHFHGQTLNFQHTRGDTLFASGTNFVAATMTPNEAGRWAVTDMVGTYEKDGVFAYLWTKTCPGVVASSVSFNGKTRDYFLSVDEVTWDYGPGGVDRATGLPLTTPGSHSQKYFEKSPTRIGGQYTKAIFRQYTDATWSTLKRRSEEEEHMGLLGPTLRAEVGDTLLVHVRNNAKYPISLLAHGFHYSFQEENISNMNSSMTPGGNIDSGKTHVYQFRVPDDFMDNMTQPCLNFIYSAARHPSRDHNSGLAGPILICKRGYLSISTKPKELFLLLSTFDENNSLYLDENIAASNLTKTLDKNDPAFQESNLMFSINGYCFGNVPKLTLCHGESVQWYVMALGSERDVHTVTFDGNAFSEHGMHRDGRLLLPGQTAALRIEAGNIGTWQVMSYNTMARDGGMYAFYEVKDCNTNGLGPANKTTNLPVPGAVVREYFITTEEVDWEYAPLKQNLMNGGDLNDPREEANVFVRDDDLFIGSMYKKAVYRGYTNTSFTVQVPVQHETILGPTMRAEVGDVVKVTFLNKATRTYSIHCRGVKTTQRESGTNYGQAVVTAPGDMSEYHWQIPVSSGPGPSDPDCIPWLYHSASDPTKDVYSGLVGTLVVCRPGILNQNGERTDVDKEVPILMSVLNENLSWYLKDNVQRFAPSRVGTDYKNDDEFAESNMMHAINGRLFDSTPELLVEYGSKVVWYLMSLGAQIDLHSFHTHGHTFVHASTQHRSDVFQTSPGTADAVEIIADNPGTWLIHCTIPDHFHAGMIVTYTVLDKGAKVPTNGSSPDIL